MSAKLIRVRGTVGLHRQFTESERVEVVIESLLFQQRGMRAFLHDLSLIQDQNAIGALDGTEPVSHDERGAVGHEAFQRLLNESFRFGIER